MELLFLYFAQTTENHFKLSSTTSFSTVEASTMGKKVSKNCKYIPDDIAFSILSKLPLKSVKRFSCIRKSWSLLLLNPNFMNLFRNNLLSKPNSLYDDSCLLLNHNKERWDRDFYLLSGDNFENKVKLDLPPPFHVRQIRILGSAINGVLCIYDCRDHRNAILWNPATKEVKVIPPSFGDLPPHVMYKHILHGFGYDHVGDDYKVIQHMHYFYNGENYFDVVEEESFWEIYSLKSNLWRKLDFDMPIRYQFPETEVYLNGMCHWWGVLKCEVYMVSFNLCNETHFTTPSPLEDDPDCFDVNLVVLNGSVAMISNYKETSSFQISILGEFGVKDSWIRLFHVEPLFGFEYPIGVGKKGYIFFIKENNELACFDLTTGAIQDIGVKENIGVKGEICFCQMVTYKKNLLSLEVIDG